jgi:hypothetical protein
MTESIRAIGVHGTNSYNSSRSETKRAMAVAAALELIALNVQGAHSNGVLETEMDSLSKYADIIQEALKTK